MSEDGVLACATGFVSLDACSVLFTVQTNRVSPGTPLGSEAAPRPHRTAGVLGVPLGGWKRHRTEHTRSTEAVAEARTAAAGLCLVVFETCAPIRIAQRSC